MVPSIMPPFRTLAATSLLTLLLASPGLAQVQVWELPPVDGSLGVGSVLVTAADMDGDSIPDLLVGSPRTNTNGPNRGSVDVVSGNTGGIIRRVDGVANGELLGDALGVLGDLDNDGVDDWIVGAPFASIGLAKNGRAEVRSGADGAFLFQIVGVEQFGLLGSAVAGLGDANGDTVPDVLVCAPFEDSNGVDSGTVSIHSGVDGSFIRNHSGDLGGDRLGLSAVSLGDINGDGIGDYGAGSPHANGSMGHLRVWSGQTGNTIYTRLGTEVDGGFATCACALDDLTGDGRPDIAIGVPYSDVAGTDAGQVVVINGATGAFVRYLWGNTGELLGTSVADGGDWNGDGTHDILVGAPGAGANGAARLFSGLDGSLLTEVSGSSNEEEYGNAVAGNFDIDGDGHSEFAVADKLSDAFGPDTGVVRSYSDHSHLGATYCFGDGSGTVCPCGNLSAGETGCANSTGLGASLEAGGSASAADDDLLLVAAGMLTGQAALAFVGTEAVNGGAGFLFGDGLRCAGGMVQRLGVQIPDSSGAATWGPGLGRVGDWGPGDSRFFQVWYRDTNGSPCASQFNLSNGMQLSVLP